MATWQRFEDIEAWQLARVYNKKMHALIATSGIKQNRRLRDQMYGSAGSIMDNIAEGFERGNNREFVLFLGYAKAVLVKRVVNSIAPLILLTCLKMPSIPC